MMRFDLDTWSEILTTITRNKTRSLLTAFGIFWGLFMLLSLLGGSQGVQALMSGTFSGFATNTGFVFANLTSKPYKGFQENRFWEMENKDVAFIKQRVKGIDAISPVIMIMAANVTYQGRKSSSAMVRGVRSNYRLIESPLMLYGRFLNELDVRNERKVCVIGKRVYEDLFPKGGNPCGRQISVDGTFYQIIGVNIYDGNMSIGGNSSDIVSIPFSTVQRAYNRGTRFDLLCFTAHPDYKVSVVEKGVSMQLKRNHLIAPDDEQAVKSFNAEAMFNLVDSLFRGIRVLAWMVGLGTLLAGAIGVSNIMMVTVKERTSEIGIRRAIGAQPRDIVFQILAESLVLTIIAGTIGLSFTVGVLSLLEQATAKPGMEVHFIISFTQAVSASLLLIVLGLLSGLAPAMRAMAIKPIDAIRDE